MTQNYKERRSNQKLILLAELNSIQGLKNSGVGRHAKEMNKWCPDMIPEWSESEL